MGGGRGGPASLVSALLSEWREQAPASSPGCPVPRPPLPGSRAQLQGGPPRALCPTALPPQVPDPVRTPGSGPAGPGGARHLGTPSDAQRGSIGPADGAAAFSLARRAPLLLRPVRLSAELAPPPRQLYRLLPRPSVLPRVSRGSTHLAPRRQLPPGAGPCTPWPPGGQGPAPPCAPAWRWPWRWRVS